MMLKCFVAIGMLPLTVIGASMSVAEEPPYVETATITASDPEGGDFFGEHLAIDGNRFVVGVEEKGVSEGAVYVYERGNDGDWVEAAKLLASDGGVQRRLGVSVAI